VELAIKSTEYKVIDDKVPEKGKDGDEQPERVEETEVRVNSNCVLGLSMTDTQHSTDLCTCFRSKDSILTRSSNASRS
jgi:hypothetical protein